MKKSRKARCRLQLLRHRLVVGHADLVVGVDVGPVVEGLGPNVDEEVVVEDREDDLEQAMLMTTARTMKLAKRMSMSKTVGVAKNGRLEDADLVVERCVEEVVRKMVMVMCRCGGVVSLLVGRVATLALLPC